MSGCFLVNELHARLAWSQPDELRAGLRYYVLLSCGTSMTGGIWKYGPVHHHRPE